MKKQLAIFTACALATVFIVLVAGCNEQQSVLPVTKDANGNEVVQAPQDHTVRDAALGGLAGFMLGRATSNNHAPAYAAPSAPAPVIHRTIIQKTIVNKTVNRTVTPPTRSYTPSRSYSSPSRSSFGGRR